MYIEAPELAARSGLRHAFFTRRGGVSEGLYASLNGGLGSSDDPPVRENRRLMEEELGIAPGTLISVHQVHSPDAVIVEAPLVRRSSKADGMVTRVPGLALAVTTADCGPVLFADPNAGVIGAAHAGWRGALTGVLEATIARMEESGAARCRIVAVLGPTISGPAYEVGSDLMTRFIDADPANERFFTANGRPSHAQFDLPAYIGARLSACGIGEVAALGRCTCTEEEHFFFRRTTHRGEADYRRLISAITLTP